MKSIKPGRGPSKLNMVSAIGAAVFGAVSYTHLRAHET